MSLSSLVSAALHASVLGRTSFLIATVYPEGRSGTRKRPTTKDVEYVRKMARLRANKRHARSRIRRSG